VATPVGFCVTLVRSTGGMPCLTRSAVPCGATLHTNFRSNHRRTGTRYPAVLPGQPEPICTAAAVEDCCRQLLA
jgi:hypothetical protein